jgi:hypothetical protein
MFHQIPPCGGQHGLANGAAILLQSGQSNSVLVRIPAKGNYQIVTAVFTLRADCPRNPPRGRVIEQEALDTRLQYVHEIVIASNVGQFMQKAADIIGLYMNPPQHAAVFCVDEKTAIQALDRLDPVLPLSPGRAERHGFEYYRHGTLSLYAALDVKTGKVQGMTAARHTSQDFVASLEGLVQRTRPAD